jgi:polyketide biosynthesis 3-hydroxy-3-methylglutaryl-CoA synthase-like enzyme PksG
MTAVGIEALNVFGGTAWLDLAELAAHRGLDRARFENLLMRQKAVALPHEDPVTYAVNAARPIIDRMTPGERERIEMVISCSESGIDFGKSLSTYIHHYLGLQRNCRLFEVKQACYSGTAGLQIAANFVLANVSPGAKVLVVATDISRYMVADGGDALTQDWSFAEPSGGAGAVAMLVSDRPLVYQHDVGASGCYGYEVMDTCRPQADTEAGDADLSLLSYLDCCENAFSDYHARVEDVDYRRSFDYLVFHTPFGGMVKGAHRTMMRKLTGADRAAIEADFAQRVAPGLEYCQRVGNIMGGTLFMALASTIDRGAFDGARRIGCFSYGSGCCSEFFSGIVAPHARERQRAFDIQGQLDRRYRLSLDEYERVLRDSAAVRFGTRTAKLDEPPPAQRSAAGSARLWLREIRDFHRLYEWAA